MRVFLSAAAAAAADARGLCTFTKRCFVLFFVWETPGFMRCRALSQCHAVGQAGVSMGAASPRFPYTAPPIAKQTETAHACPGATAVLLCCYAVLCFRSDADGGRLSRLEADAGAAGQ